MQPSDLVEMVRHWINTPAGSYLGSSYGNPIKNTLQRPMSDVGADEVLEKMRIDLPVLSILPSSAVNIYAYPSPERVDGVEMVVEVGGELISLGGASNG